MNVSTSCFVSRFLVHSDVSFHDYSFQHAGIFFMVFEKSGHNILYVDL